MEIHWSISLFVLLNVALCLRKSAVI